MQPALIMILMLKALNKIVTAYLDIAEVHALNKEPFFHLMREALLLWLPIAPAVVKEAG